MFTGIIEELGILIASIEYGTSLCMQISANKVLSDLKVDDSVAINGVCLTVAKKEPSFFEVIAVSETLARTTIRSLKIGDKVNLERAATLETRLGGHLVQGHIDGVALLMGVESLDGSWLYSFDIPLQFMKYISPQGSITINGVSLTVARIEQASIHIAIIPHTYEMTTFATLQTGDFVNFEVDCIAKMIERLIA
ncbi:MAG: riboflavin synthase [bacterium]